MKTLLKDAVKNIRYVITKGTKCGTFQKGDHIKVMEDGSVLSREGQGWQNPEDITELVGLVELEIDREEIVRLKHKVADIQKQIKWMENQCEHAKKDRTVGQKICALRAHPKRKLG